MGKDNRLLHQIKTAMNSLDDVKLNFNDYVVGAQIREVYKGLQAERAASSAKRIMIHVENVVRELEHLEDALKDGQIVLLKKVEYDEQKASR